MKKVAAAVILRSGKVLITRRGPAENLAGCWSDWAARQPNWRTHDDRANSGCGGRRSRDESGVQKHALTYQHYFLQLRYESHLSSQLHREAATLLHRRWIVNNLQQVNYRFPNERVPHHKIFLARRHMLLNIRLKSVTMFKIMATPATPLNWFMSNVWIF